MNRKRFLVAFWIGFAFMLPLLGVLYVYSNRPPKPPHGQANAAGDARRKPPAADDYSRLNIEELTAKAEKGDGKAQFVLGVKNASGDGLAKDLTEAVRWYRKAAEQGLGPAQYNLGVCYQKGNGVPEDYAEAVRWYRKAAEQGLAQAQSRLGLSYYLGHGVPRDLAEAVKWFRMAAAQGDAVAQNILGGFYYVGEGVPRDYTEAYKWVNLAAAQGVKDATKLRDEMEKGMTPAQIAEGQRLSREFKPKVEIVGAPSIKQQ